MGKADLGMSPEQGWYSWWVTEEHRGRGIWVLCGQFEGFYCRTMRRSLKKRFFSEKGGGAGRLGSGEEEEKFGEGGGVAFMAPSACGVHGSRQGEPCPANKLLLLCPKQA